MGFAHLAVYWLPSMYLYVVKIIKSPNYFIKKAFEKINSENKKQAHLFPMVKYFTWALIQHQQFKNFAGLLNQTCL